MDDGLKKKCNSNHKKIMNILEETTGGRSYKAHKYSLDNYNRSSIIYESNANIWNKSAETDQYKDYVDLKELVSKISQRDERILSFFLDGSRRVFKVDDIAYSHSGGRSVIYPILAGQIGIGCCKRVNKEMKLEKYISKVVLSLPDIANADGVSGFFPSVRIKINECEQLKRLGVNVSDILQYKTSNEIGRAHV